MKILINNQFHEVPCGTTVASLLSALNINAKGVALAIDGRIVPRASWDKQVVSEGANITLISATCGG